MTAAHDVCEACRFGASYNGLEHSSPAKIGVGTSLSRTAGVIATQVSQMWPSTVFGFTKITPAPGQDAVLVEWVNGPTRQTVAAIVAGLHEDWVPQVATTGEMVFPNVVLSRMYSPKVWVAAACDLFCGDRPRDGEPVQDWALRVVIETRQELDKTADPDLFWGDVPDGLLLLAIIPQRPTTNVRWLQDAVASGLFDLLASAQP